MYFYMIDSESKNLLLPLVIWAKGKCDSCDVNNLQSVSELIKL